jgi:hypothetical protein
MFQAILMTQWKSSKVVLLGAVVVVFVLPVVSVRQVGYMSDSPWFASLWLRALEPWGIWYGAMAAALGLVIATSAWASDHRGSHVYALSLPIERWKYVLLRFAAGALLLTPAVFSLWIGSLVATGVVDLPAGLRAYPTALAIRFGLAAFTAYSVLFAVSAATPRTAGIILVTIGGVLAASLLLGAAGAGDLGVDLFEGTIQQIVNWPGPFSVFTERWMLIDV